MKVIEIKFQGVVKPYFSIVAKENEKSGLCYVCEKASNFIKAQSQDGMVYYGVEPINHVTDEPFGFNACKSIWCTLNGDTTRYNIKGNVYDASNPFAPAKKGEYEWRWVELRVIDVME